MWIILYYVVNNAVNVIIGKQLSDKCHSLDIQSINYITITFIVPIRKEKIDCMIMM